MRICLILLLLSSIIRAADNPVADFQQAMAGNDAAAKKQAIRTLSSHDIGKDEDIYPLLISAITDRQAGETAVAVLQSRTGTTPTGGLYKIGEDPARIQGAWQRWLDDWKKAQQIKKLEKELKEKLEQKNKPAAKPAASPAPAAVEAPSGDAPAEGSVPTVPAADLGKLDRVIFKSGGSLVCYVQSKRTDAEGNLVSIRIVHQDGAGEEIIAADLISRIEEDIR